MQFMHSIVHASGPFGWLAVGHDRDILQPVNRKGLSRRLHMFKNGMQSY